MHACRNIFGREIARVIVKSTMYMCTSSQNQKSSMLLIAYQPKQQCCLSQHETNLAAPSPPFCRPSPIPRARRLPGRCRRRRTPAPAPSVHGINPQGRGRRWPPRLLWRGGAMIGGNRWRRRGGTLGGPECCFGLCDSSRRARFLRRLLEISKVVLFCFGGRQGRARGRRVEWWPVGLVLVFESALNRVAWWIQIRQRWGHCEVAAFTNVKQQCM